MGTLLVKNAKQLLTMDETRRKIADGAIFVRDNVIAAVGPTRDLPARADRVIDASRMVVLPGLINTHHHLYQTLTAPCPRAERGVVRWLVYLYRCGRAGRGSGVYQCADRLAEPVAERLHDGQ